MSGEVQCRHERYQVASWTFTSEHLAPALREAAEFIEHRLMEGGQEYGEFHEAAILFNDELGTWHVTLRMED